mgnify:CR=1 FL=1
MKQKLLFFSLLFFSLNIIYSQDGDLDTGFNIGTGANATVKKMAIQPDGKIIVAGAFTTFNNVSKNRIVRLNTDGTIDASFTGLVNDGQVNAIVVQSDGKILIGGTFGGVNNTGRNRIARLNSDGSLDNAFSYAGGINGIVYDIKLQSDGRILVGGNFNSYNGYGGAVDLARINPNGTPDTSVNIFGNGAVYSLSIQNDGKIIVVGQFNSLSGTGRNNIARLNINGSIDGSFNYSGGTNGVLYDSQIQDDGKIIIAGNFNNYSGYGSSGMQRINSNGTPDTSFNTNIGGYLNSVSIQDDGKFIISGSFTNVNSSGRNNIARINANGALDTSFSYSTGLNSIAWDSKIQSDGKIIIGGQFTNYSNTNSNRFVRINGVTQSAVPATHLNFDGTNDYINCGTNSIFDFTTGTIEAWFKPSISSSNQVVFANRTAANNTETRWSLHINENSNTLGFYNGSNGFETLSVGNIDPDVWYHIAFVMTTTSTTVFVDGIDKGAIPSGINMSSTGNPFLIGASDITNSFPNEYFKGSIDEVRVWNYARSAAEIDYYKNCELIGDESGLVAYYQFNQGEGSVSNAEETTLNDVTSNGNNGTLTNFALTGTTSNWLEGSVVTTDSNCVTLSVNEMEVEFGVKLFPNPTKNSVTITLNNQENAQLSVYDINGRVLLSKQLNSITNIDVSPFANGIYLFKIKTAKGEVLKRIIKN